MDKAFHMVSQRALLLGDIEESYIPVAMKSDLKAPSSHIEEYRRTYKPKVTPLARAEGKLKQFDELMVKVKAR